MNRSRLLMIGAVALAVGLLVSYIVFIRLRTLAGTDNKANGAQVLVAANDIQVGTKLAANDVRVITLPQSAVPPGAFSAPAKVLGRGAVQLMSKGEFILPTKLAPLNGGTGLPSMIPPGMRAVSVRVNDVVSVAGFVQPGTRVDVMSTGSQGGDRQTTTVLENVAVIAVGKSLDGVFRGCANRLGDHAPGFSGRRAETGPGFAGRAHSVGPAQSTGHKKGRHQRHPGKFAVSEWDTGRDRAQAQFPQGGSEGHSVCASALPGRNDPWQQTRRKQV